MNNTAKYCLYRKWCEFLKFLKAVLAIQICLLQILLIFAKLMITLG